MVRKKFQFWLMGNASGDGTDDYEPLLSLSSSSSEEDDSAPLYSSVWQWLRGVLIATLICLFLVALLMKWLDYVHRNQYYIEQEQREKQKRSLLRSNSTDDVDHDDDDGLDIVDSTHDDAETHRSYNSTNIDEINDDDDEVTIEFDDKEGLELLDSSKTKSSAFS